MVVLDFLKSELKRCLHNQSIMKKMKNKNIIMMRTLRNFIISHEADRFETFLKKAKENSYFDINDRDEQGVTLLGYAIEYGSFLIFQILVKNLELGVDVNKGSQYSGLKIIRGKFDCDFRDASDYKLEPLFHVYKCIIHFYSETAGFGADKSSLFKMIIELMNHPKIDFTPPGLFGIFSKTSLLAVFARSLRLGDLTGVNPAIIEIMRMLKQAAIVAHKFDVKGYINIKEHSMSLEGFHLGTAAEDIIETYKDFIKHEAIRVTLNQFYNNLYKTKDIDYFAAAQFEENPALSMLIDLKCIEKPVSLEHFKERDMNGRITPIYISEPDHALAYLFYDQYCVRVNCGGSSDLSEVPGIKIYRIHDKKAMLKEMPNLLESTKLAINDEYLLGYFASKSKLELVYTIERPKQTVGNCTVRSFEEMLHAMFIMNFFKYYKGIKSKKLFFINFSHKSEKEAFQIAERTGAYIYKLFSYFEKARGFEQFSEIREYFSQKLQLSVLKVLFHEIKNRESMGWCPMSVLWNKQPIHSKQPIQFEQTIPLEKSLKNKAEVKEVAEAAEAASEEHTESQAKVESEEHKKNKESSELSERLESSEKAIVKFKRKAIIKLKKEDLAILAQENLGFENGDIKALLEYINQKSELNEELEIEHVMYTFFKANLNGVENIDYIIAQDEYVLEMESDEMRDQLKKLISSFGKSSQKKKFA